MTRTVLCAENRRAVRMKQPPDHAAHERYAGGVARWAGTAAGLASLSGRAGVAAERQFALAVESTHTPLHSTVPVAQLRLGAEPPLAVLFPEPPVAGVLPQPPVEGVLPEPPASVAGLPAWPGLAALYEPHEAMVAGHQRERTCKGHRDQG